MTDLISILFQCSVAASISLASWTYWNGGF